MNESKKVLTYPRLSTFLSEIKKIFATPKDLNVKADKSHSHNASDIVAGTVSVINGGTGASSPNIARSNLSATNIVRSYNEPDSWFQNVGDLWFKIED